MKNFMTAALILLSSSVSVASVNMRNGSFTESWIDFVHPGQGFDIRLERFYSSRSLFIGLFGFGWCSSLETQLSITSDGIVNLTECGGGLEATYYPESFDLKSRKATVEGILAHLSKSNKLSKTGISNLRRQLNANTKMRFEYANRLHMVDTKKLKTMKNTFVAKTKGIEKIVFNGKNYVRKRYDGVTEKFSKTGQLVQITNASGHWLKIVYKGPKIAYLVDTSGRRVNFSYAANGTLNKVYNGKGLETSYQFENENLVGVSNMWDKSYSYKYDDNHNLTAISFPDGTAMTMTYDRTNDWIKTYTNRIGCREEFAFTLSPKDPKNHYWGTFARQCKKKAPISGRHEFWYKTYSLSRDKYLHRAKETRSDTFRDMYLHPYLGKPTSVRENQYYSGFAYYGNGLLNKEENKAYGEKRKIQNWTKSVYTYDFKKYLLTQSRRTRLNSQGKVLDKRVTKFRYDKKGLLKQADAPGGQLVQLSYHPSGRVSLLANHKKDRVSLIYSDQSTKPITLRHNRLGAIDIEYDNQGEVAKVSGQEKRTIASSVIQSFLQMVEILGPLGDTLKI